MYCKQCGKANLSRANFCEHCGHPLEQDEDKTKHRVEAVEDSGYNLGIVTTGFFLAWCALQIYFYFVNYPGRESDLEKFWPFDEYSAFSNYDVTEPVFFIFFPALGLCLLNFFTKRKDLDEAGLAQLYDLSYKPEFIPTLLGLIVFVVSLSYFLVTKHSYSYEAEKMATLKNLFFVFTVVVRIGLLIYTIRLAKKLNRNPVNWGAFAFIAPAVTIIILGQKRKLREI